MPRSDERPVAPCPHPLAPFVAAGDKHRARYERNRSTWFEQMPDHWPLELTVTMGDYRRARAALADHEGGDATCTSRTRQAATARAVSPSSSVGVTGAADSSPRVDLVGGQAGGDTPALDLAALDAAYQYLQAHVVTLAPLDEPTLTDVHTLLNAYPVLRDALTTALTARDDARAERLGRCSLQRAAGEVDRDR